MGLKEAIKAKTEFLAQHPELQGFQRDLDNTFKDFGNDPETNMSIIRDAIKTNIDKLQRMRDEITS